MIQTKSILPMIILIIAILFACKNNPSATTTPNNTPLSSEDASKSQSQNNAAAAQASSIASLVANIPSPEIHFQVEGFANGKAQLVGIYGDQNYLADTMTITTGGKFRLKRDTAYNPGLYFIVLPDNQNFQMILDKDQRFEMKTNASDLIGNMKVTGSDDNDILYQVLNTQVIQERELTPIRNAASGKGPGDPATIALNKKNDEIRAARIKQLNDFEAKYPGSFAIKFRLAGQNPAVADVKDKNGNVDFNRQSFIFRNEYWKNFDFKDVRLMNTPLVGNKVKQFFQDLVPQHQDSLIKYMDQVLPQTLGNPEIFKYLSNYFLIKYEPGKTTLMDGEAVFSHVIKHYYTRQSAPWLSQGDFNYLQQRAEEMSHCLLNQKAPDVVAKDPTGATKSIYEIHTPYIIVYLFHTDCEHCQKATPELAAMLPKLKARGVSMFTIAVNTTDAEWKKFIAQYHMEGFTNVFDPTNKAVYAKYYVDNTPEIYLINKERKIIAKNLKVEQIMTVLDRDAKGDLK